MTIELEDQILKDFGGSLMKTCFWEGNASIVVLNAQNSVYQSLIIF